MTASGHPVSRRNRGESGHRGWKPRFGGAYFLPQPWHHVSMRPHTITLCLLATPALADLAGVASVKRAALSAYAEHLLGIVA